MTPEIEKESLPPSYPALASASGYAEECQHCLASPCMCAAVPTIKKIIRSGQSQLYTRGGAGGNRIVKKNISANELRKLTQEKEWELVGEIFNFTPQYYKMFGNTYFDWAQLPPAFWKVYRSAGARCESKATCQPVSLIATAKKPPLLPVPKLKKQRHKTWQDQGGICHYCLGNTLFTDWTLDHKRPTARGGANRPENIVGSCFTCNNRKGHMSYDAFLQTEYLKRARELVANRAGSGNKSQEMVCHERGVGE